MKIYRYYNPNPRGRSVGDCTVRAVSAALGVSWDAAFRGIAGQARSMADMPSADAVWGAYLKSRGFRRRTIANTCPDCYTAADFAREHPHGVYVLAFGGHVATVRDGVLLDSWDSSDLIPVYYYAKED